MRQIKFRAWDKEKKAWIRPSFYGDILVGGYEIAIVNNKPKNGGYDLDSFKLFNHQETDNIEIIQFTGLLDKNGKEIYERDIFAPLYNRIRPFVVEFQDGAFNCARYSVKNSEVIGNIYENPELLK
jgi:uncharacterized phage protein (TIGR01671 family)